VRPGSAAKAPVRATPEDFLQRVRTASVRSWVYIYLCHRFSIEDVALFMPTTPREPRVYVAFHMNCPHRYLAPQSLEVFRQQRSRCNRT
jgi:hypothetical protein